MSLALVLPFEKTGLRHVAPSILKLGTHYTFKAKKEKKNVMN